MSDKEVPSKNSGPIRRPLWIIEGHHRNWTGVFVIDPGSDRECLPVFSFREEAETFVYLLADANGGGGWKARETSNGELVSVLYSLCASVRNVALDPPSVTDCTVLGLFSTDRKCFVRHLVGEPGAEKTSGEAKYAHEKREER